MGRYDALVDLLIEVAKDGIHGPHTIWWTCSNTFIIRAQPALIHYLR